ncbi:hypothetical protein [Natrinema sp. SYSU A 869]|uniref:hypothetical protein n=1 Tax=Natrinema sp. SYSU A 869 TaxID=2871694 RepID=UPI001CA424A2|nr:hypothetical protein [Natrinema sp. SYSU A 869]
MDSEFGSIISDRCWRLERLLKLGAESVDILSANDQRANECPQRIVGIDGR